MNQFLKNCCLLLLTLCVTSGMAQVPMTTSKVTKIAGRHYFTHQNKLYEIDSKKIIVKLKKGKNLPTSLEKRVKPIAFDIFTIPVPDSLDVEKYVSIMESKGVFESVEYNCLYEPAFLSNDTYIGSQWNISQIKADLAWEITTGSPLVKVAVIDDGVDMNHEDLYYGYDSYANLSVNESVDYVSSTDHTPNSSHGTIVAGIIGAKTNNNRGIAGVAGGYGNSGVKIISYRTDYSTEHIINAVFDAVNKNVKVINMSLSGPYSIALSSTINYAYQQGVSIVCSTGNEGAASISYPASMQNTIAVGNIAYNDLIANDSNYGTGIDLVAPGQIILSTCRTTDGKYDFFSGTSCSAPHVAGTIALMLSVNPNLTPSLVRTILDKTATKISKLTYSYNNQGWNQYVGYGRLDAAAAVLEACNPVLSGPDVVCCSSTATYTVSNLPSCATINWSFPGYGSPIQTYGNSCTFTNNNSQNTTLTLKADIKINGIIIKTLEKNVKMHGNFFAYYISGAFSSNVTLGTPLTVARGEMTYIESPNFRNKHVAYNSSYVVPYNWEYDGGDVISLMYPQNGNGPIIINATALPGEPDCDDFQLSLYPSGSSNSICVVQGDGCIEIAVDTDITSKSIAEWSIDIYNAITGRRVLSNAHKGNTCILSTTNWPSGIYTLKVNINDSIISKKIIIK